MAIVHVIHECVLDCQTLAFDEHAIKMMDQRNVSEDEVIACLKHPDQTGLPADLNRERFRKLFAPTHSVDVVFERDPTQLVVITVIRKTRVKK